MLSVETFDTLSQAAQGMRDGSRFIAGGTLVMRAVNYGDQSFNRIVRARDTDLRLIRMEGGKIVIGSGATMSDVLASRDLVFLAPVARAIGGPAVRNMATVGGNLFASHPYGDFATALLALDADVTMADGERMTLEHLLASRETLRGLVSSISIARPNDGDFRFRKVSRVKPKGVSVISIAAWLPRTGSRIAAARVAFGAMGPTPLRAKAVENALNGVSLDEAGIARALSVATDGLDPQDDALASAWYRREVAPVPLAAIAARGGAVMAKTPINFTLNGADTGVFVEGGDNLLNVLRRGVGDLSPKYGCGQGTCGTCTVLVDGEPQLSCLTLAETVQDRTVETTNGLADGPDLHPLQTEFMEGFAAQCGYCTPGMLMAAKALLSRNPRPSRDDVIEAISGNICRCTGYDPIVDAILAAAAKMNGRAA